MHAWIYMEYAWIYLRIHKKFSFDNLINRSMVEGKFESKISLIETLEDVSCAIWFFTNLNKIRCINTKILTQDKYYW